MQSSQGRARTKELCKVVRGGQGRKNYAKQIDACMREQSLIGDQVSDLRISGRGSRAFVGEDPGHRRNTVRRYNTVQTAMKWACEQSVERSTNVVGGGLHSTTRSLPEIEHKHRSRSRRGKYAKKKERRG